MPAKEIITLLPLGSFEFHGHLPWETDTLIASAIAGLVADEMDRSGLSAHYQVEAQTLPAIPLSCSHEWDRSVSLNPVTLCRVLDDVADQVPGPLLVVNAHGGNHVLTNWVLTRNRSSAQAWSFPRDHNWKRACEMAGIESVWGSDVHAGEIETSIMLAIQPERVGADVEDHPCNERALWDLVGMGQHALKGVIGFPSRASAAKGSALLSALARLAVEEIPVLIQRWRERRSKRSIPA